MARLSLGILRKDQGEPKHNGCEPTPASSRLLRFVRWVLTANRLPLVGDDRI